MFIEDHEKHIRSRLSDVCFKEASVARGFYKEQRFIFSCNRCFFRNSALTTFILSLESPLIHDIQRILIARKAFGLDSFNRSELKEYLSRFHKKAHIPTRPAQEMVYIRSGYPSLDMKFQIHTDGYDTVFQDPGLRKIVDATFQRLPFLYFFRLHPIFELQINIEPGLVSVVFGNSFFLSNMKIFDLFLDRLITVKDYLIFHVEDKAAQ